MSRGARFNGKSYLLKFVPMASLVTKSQTKSSWAKWVECKCIEITGHIWILSVRS